MCAYTCDELRVATHVVNQWLQEGGVNCHVCDSAICAVSLLQSVARHLSAVCACRASRIASIHACVRGARENMQASVHVAATTAECEALRPRGSSFADSRCVLHAPESARALGASMAGTCSCTAQPMSAGRARKTRKRGENGARSSQNGARDRLGQHGYRSGAGRRGCASA